MPDPTPAPEDADTLDEGRILLDLLFSHRMSWVQDFLRANDLPVSGTKDELRERIEDLLAAETISIGELIALLESVEGWGNQHAYLYRAGDTLLDFLSNETQVKAKLKSRGCSGLFNRAVSLVLPPVPTLTTIQWSADRIRFVWIERRPWRKRLPEQDQKTSTIELDAFRPMMSRGMVSFSCDLTSGHADLLIQRLPSGENYAAERTKFQNLLAQFFDVAQLTPVLVSRAIKKFDDDPKIRKRACQYSTVLGSGVSYTSRSRQEDVYNDPSIKKAREALGKNMAGRHGNFYSPTGHESQAHEVVPDFWTSRSVKLLEGMSMRR